MTTDINSLKGIKLMVNKSNKDAEWSEAKRKCRLNEETLRMAKEMGLNPRSLIKNIPNKSQQWKAPVHVWIREMYEERQEKARKKKAVKNEAGQTEKQLPENIV